MAESEAANGARGVTVRLLAGDPNIREGHRRLGATSRKALWFAVPAALISLLPLSRVSLGDGVLVGVVIVAGTSALIGGGTAILLRLQLRRALRYPGRVWSSKPTFFLGPGEGDGGLDGATSFSIRHREQGLEPLVRLVLTAGEIALVPQAGRNRPLVLPMATVRFIDVDTDPKKGGVSLTTRDGKVAVIALWKGREQLVEAMRSLGAAVEPDLGPGS